MKTWNSDKSNPRIEFIEGLQLDCIDEFSGSKALVIDDLSLTQNKELTNHFYVDLTTNVVPHSI